STDGEKWARSSAPASYGLWSVKWVDGVFWSVGRGGEVITTTDGQTWETLLRTDTKAFFDFAHSDSAVVVVGWDLEDLENPGPAIGTSADGGHEWAFQTLPFEGALFGVEWTGERFVAVGMSGMVAASIDGFEWKARSLGQEIVLDEVTWGGHSLVAIGGHYGVGPLFAVSRTGEDWELMNFPDELGGVDDLTWTGDCFVAVDRSRSHDQILIASADGLVWSVESSGTALGLMTTASDGQQLIATGLRGAIVRRTELPQCIPGPRNPTGRSLPTQSGKGTEDLLSATGSIWVGLP
ncbi:MAG: hypothetical protein K8R59_04050, partial [Thermoanaerobaculales bacterium]|nr:hypothetical protein [Thermoanaerobaculales bacterium]